MPQSRHPKGSSQGGRYAPSAMPDEPPSEDLHLNYDGLSVRDKDLITMRKECERLTTIIDLGSFENDAELVQHIERLKSVCDQMIEAIELGNYFDS